MESINARSVALLPLEPTAGDGATLAWHAMPAAATTNIRASLIMSPRFGALRILRRAAMPRALDFLGPREIGR